VDVIDSPQVGQPIEAAFRRLVEQGDATAVGRLCAGDARWVAYMPSEVVDVEGKWHVVDALSERHRRQTEAKISWWTDTLRSCVCALQDDV
jgi:hypothetical protein